MTVGKLYVFDLAVGELYVIVELSVGNYDMIVELGNIPPINKNHLEYPYPPHKHTQSLCNGLRYLLRRVLSIKKTTLIAWLILSLIDFSVSIQLNQL